MRKNIIRRDVRIFDSLREFEDINVLFPFITFKFLSKKQEETNDVDDFQNKYGLILRDYELLGNVVEKYENDDESYVSNMTSAINALKYSNNQYIKEIFTRIPNKYLKEENLSKIIDIIKKMDPIRLYNRITHSARYYHNIEDHYYSIELVQLLIHLASTNHEIKRFYDPFCRDAQSLVFLENFQEATLYEKDVDLYYQAIQNMIIHEVPLDKVSITNEEIFFDKDESKYDTIISRPYKEKLEQQLLIDYFIESKEEIGESESKNPFTLHFFNLLKHLDDDGIIVTVVPQDFLVKKNNFNLREYLINNNLIDAIIEYDTGYRSRDIVILVLKKNKNTSDILFIKQDNYSFRWYKRNYSRIKKCYESREIIERFSDIISNDEIIKNDFNLNPKRYVYTLNYQSRDVDEVIKEQQEYTSKIRELDEEIEEMLKKVTDN